MKHLISLILILTMALSCCSIGASADTSVSSVTISPNFNTMTAEISAEVVSDEDAYIIIAYFGENGRIINSPEVILSKASDADRTLTRTDTMPAGTVKAKAFIWDTNYIPLVDSSSKGIPVIKPEYITNGTFEGGTLDGWTSSQAKYYAVSDDAAYNSNYGMHHKRGGTTITQDLTADLNEAGQGYYHLSMYARSVAEDGLNVRIKLTYALDGVTQTSAIKDAALTDEWSQINLTFAIGEYIANGDGTESLDEDSIKAITSALLTFNAQKNDGSSDNRNPHIPSDVKNTDARYQYYVDDISLIKLSNLSGTKKGYEIEKPSVFVIAASQTQTYGPEANPRQGWGYTLGDSFSDEVNWCNYAVAGYSTRTFVQGVIKDSKFSPPKWPIYKHALKEGDYVIVCLGHNDTGDEYKATTPEQFEANLDVIVGDATKAGANVIFVSNMITVSPNKLIDEKEDSEANIRLQDYFVPYAEEHDIPCIDMNYIMQEMQKELSKDPAFCEAHAKGESPIQNGLYLFNLADNGFLENDSDYRSEYTYNEELDKYYDATHIQYRGAQYVADFIENQIKSKALDIRELLDNPETELISNGGFEAGLHDWTAPEERTFTFEVPEGAPQRFNNNFGKLTTTGTISQDITTPLKAYGKKVYTLSADVTADVNVVVKVNGNTVANATLNSTTKTATIDLSSIGTVNNAVIEFTSATECTFDNITLK